MSGIEEYRQRTIGVLGGGQLGRMFVQVSRQMGHRVRILDTSPDCPAGQLADETVIGDVSDQESIAKLAIGCDVVTVETEHVNVAGLLALQRGHIQVQPDPSTIALIQDKLEQKEHFSGNGCQVGPYRVVNTLDDVHKAATDWGFPLMLKARRFAYDGYGNAVIQRMEDIEGAISKLHRSDPVANPLYVEKWVPFIKELAVMVARRFNGEVVAYPVVETIQRDNVCSVVLVPAAITAETAKHATTLALKSISCLSGAGIFGVELFLLKDGTMLLNEVAPRPHNSGHYTIEACATSQFEQHLRAILDLPLGDCSLKVGAAMMINMLGVGESYKDSTEMASVAMSVKGASIHWYNKNKLAPRRKLGHITIVAPSMEELDAQVAPFRVMPQIASTFMQISDRRVQPIVSIIMGSDSDISVMKAAAVVLDDFGVPYEFTIVSAHRTPERMFEHAKSAVARGFRVIIAGAGGAAHLPGMVAAITPLPVIGVPVRATHLDGHDSLLSIVQMPRGIPVATVAINNATNAGLLAIRILGVALPALVVKMEEYQAKMKEQVEEKVEVLEQKGWQNYSAAN